jgi:NAD-dependent deacetylase sirtuin 4
MIGWKAFDDKLPNEGHYALAQLEQRRLLGVSFEDQSHFYADPEDFYFSSGQRTLAVVTQNVDALHRRAGSKDIIELHGRGGVLKCMTCGSIVDRNRFHEHLGALNNEWLKAALIQAGEDDRAMRPDGDAAITLDFEGLQIPSCEHCGGFLKPDVVFFGDTVPVARVAQVAAAVDACDGLLVVGSSLAVHSAFRHVRAASKNGTPIAILNVGETRAESEKIPEILKIDAPAGATLSRLASCL